MTGKSKTDDPVQCYRSVNATHAWVCFDDDTRLGWLSRLLRPGFRHCWIMWADSKAWHTMDLVAHDMELVTHYHLGPEFDLPAWHRAQGQIMVLAHFQTPPQRPAPVAFLNCVEVIKRFLGIHDAFIFTPYQLYRHLKEAERVRQDQEMLSQRSGRAKDGPEYRPV